MSAKKPPKPAAQKAPVPLEKAPSEKRLFWFLVLITLLVFGNTIGHGFVLDDIAVIQENKLVHMGFGGIPQLFSTFYWEGYWDSNAGLYRPLSLVMFAIEWAISPNNPVIHHVVNVLLYAVTIGMLFRLLRLLFKDASVWIAFAIALLFAVHPIHTEVVANIKSRDEILCMLFFVLTFRYILKNGLDTTTKKLIAAGLFLLCLLSKEAGILFLPVIGVWFWLFRNEKAGAILKTLLPLIVVSLCWLALHQYVIRTSPQERIVYSYLDNSLVGCPDKASQAATGVAILGRYLLKSVAPVNMSYDYSYNQVPCETFGSGIVLVTLLLVGLAIFAIVRFRRTQPAIAFGLLYFGISIALVTNIFTLIGATMGDRLLFAPVLGICIVVVFGVYALLKQTQVVRFGHSALYLFLVIAIAGSAASFRRNKTWESNETLFLADAENAPNSARVWFNKGTQLMQQLPKDPSVQARFLPEVIACFERALAIDPNDHGTHVNLGVCYYRIGDYKKSILHTKQALFMEKGAHTSTRANLADAYFKNGDTDSAIAIYEQIIGFENATVTNYNFMGVAYFNQQRFDEAAAVFEKGLKRFPNDKELLLNLGSAYGSANRLQESRQAFEKLVAIDPQNYKAMQFLGMTCDRLGDLECAKKWYDKLVEAGIIQ